MIGIILFWLHYILAGVLLYTILRCSYKYVKTENRNWRTEYIKSEEKAKFPLWLILIFICIFFIPVVNLLTFISFMVIKSGTEVNQRLYYKSFLTKEY